MEKKWIFLTLKLLISGGLIWLLFDSVDLQSAKERVLSAKSGALLGMIAIYSLQPLVLVWRWKIVIRAMNTGLPFLRALGITYIGQFFNQALPSSVGGDAVRMYKTYKSGLTVSQAVNSIILDRVATVLGLILLALLAVPFFSGRVGEAEARWIIPAASIFALGGIVGLAALMVLDNLPPRFAHMRLVQGLALLAANTRSLFLSPRRAFAVILASLIGHANVTFGVYLMAVSLGLGVTWIDCMVLMPPVLLLTTIPISIAGWGVREGAMVTAFGIIGVTAEGALVLSVMFGLTAIFMALPGGLVWLMSGDRQIASMEEVGDVLGEVEVARQNSEVGIIAKNEF